VLNGDRLAPSVRSTWAMVTTHARKWVRADRILCSDGIGSSRKSWVRTAEVLAKSYRVFAYDQRGHGDSAAIAGPMTHEQSVLDLQAVARAIDGDVFALYRTFVGRSDRSQGWARGCRRRVIAIDPMIHQARARWAAISWKISSRCSPPGCAREAAIREMFAACRPSKSTRRSTPCET